MNDQNDIVKLREICGAGVMDCKKALDEARGDFDKALKIIKEKGLAKSAKRADRDTGAGKVFAYVHGGRIGVLLDLRAETDFVVKSDPFQELAKELLMQIAALPAKDVNELLKQLYVRDDKRTVEELVKEVIGKTGENVRINAFNRIEI